MSNLPEGFCEISMMGTAVSRPVLLERNGEASALLRIRSHSLSQKPDLYMDFIITDKRVRQVIDEVVPGTFMYLRASLEHTPRARTAIDPGCSGFRGRVGDDGNLVILDEEYGYG